jgi:transposase
MARDGLVAVMTVAAATSTAVFLSFIEGMLIPALHARPEALVAMDNLAPHKAASVRAALDRAGLEHRHLPAYSPDMNPIEPCWSKLKGELRAAAPRSLDALNDALPGALNAITPDNARAWFHHSGYRPI